MKPLSMLLLGLICAGGAPPAAAQQQPSGSLRPARLHVIVGESMFGTVNQGDAIAFMNVWAKRVGLTYGFQFDTKVEIAQSFGRAGSYFSAIDVGYKASSCVLPLFFGKIDACVVAASSDALVEVATAMPVQRHPDQTELAEALLSLHMTVAGAQLGIIFRTGPLMSTSREKFESVNVLRSEYLRIVGPAGPGNGIRPGRLDEFSGKDGR